MFTASWTRYIGIEIRSSQYMSSGARYWFMAAEQYFCSVYFIADPVKVEKGVKLVHFSLPACPCHARLRMMWRRSEETATKLKFYSLCFEQKEKTLLYVPKRFTVLTCRKLTMRMTFARTNENLFCHLRFIVIRLRARLLSLSVFCTLIQCCLRCFIWFFASTILLYLQDIDVILFSVM